jgi:hypothetical protein
MARVIARTTRRDDSLDTAVGENLLLDSAPGPRAAGVARTGYVD